MGQRIEQCRLAGVRVSHERNCRNRGGFAPLALLGADAADIFDLLLQVPHTAGNFAAIGFEFRFAGATGTDATSQLRHLDAMPGQAGHHVLQLREFNLQLAFASAGVAREDVEDELGAVDYAPLDDPFDIALLRGTKVVIKQDHVGINGCGSARNFLELAGTD